MISLSNLKAIFGGEEKPSTKAFKGFFKKILELYSNSDRKGFSLKSKCEAFFDDCKAKEKKMT